MAHVDYAAGGARDLDAVAELFAQWNPGFGIGYGEQRGETGWRAEPGSRVCWVQEGAGEVWLPRGFRTREGDGDPLPAAYLPEPADTEWIAAVQAASKRVGEFTGDLRTAVAGICARLREGVFRGDIANDLWAWIECDGEAPDDEFARFIRLLVERYDRVGWSVKQAGSWESVQAGDQLIAGPEELRVRGDFGYWWISTPQPVAHIPPVRRLRYLRDTAGGCNFRFDAFRRMSLTWYACRGVTAANRDGVNQLNSHFVNIADETSRAHYHPREAVGGGKPQGEIYFVADPAVYRLNTYGRAAGLELWPDIEGANRDRQHKVKLDLRPGSVVYITPGTGHRGVDVFANVVVLPGYKPKNLIFL